MEDEEENFLHTLQATAPTHHKRQRSAKKPIPEKDKDTKYFERRRRNNVAAKRSRDNRRFRAEKVAVIASRLQDRHLKMQTINEHLEMTVACMRTTYNHLQNELDRLRLDSPEEEEKYDPSGAARYKYNQSTRVNQFNLNGAAQMYNQGLDNLQSHGLENNLQMSQRDDMEDVKYSRLIAIE